MSQQSHPCGCEPTTQRGRYRRDCIIDAATAVFMEQGYEAASVAEIGRRAGGSLQTLYRHFGNKEGLFRAIVEDKARRVYEPLESAEILEAPPDEALYDLGMRLARLSLSPEALMVHRVVIGESHRNPDLRRVFLESGPGRSRDLLAHYLRHQVELGHLAITDCDAAAMQFLDMVKGSFALPALLGDPPSPDDPAVEAAVRQAVAIFVEGATTASAGHAQRAG